VADYIENREAVPRNLFAFTGALSVPLTILKALQLTGLRFQDGDVVRIDLPGSRVLELCNVEATFAELGRALPGNRVWVRLVGPELRSETHSNEVLRIENVSLTMHRELYQNLLVASQSTGALPHVAVAFHAGVQEYDSWAPAIVAATQLHIPLAVTGYSLSDIAAGLRVIYGRCHPRPHVAYEGFNPFACVERMLVDEGQQRIFLLGDDDDDPNLLFGTEALNNEVESAGGLLKLAERMDPRRADVVSINSWWFLLWDGDVWNGGGEGQRDDILKRFD